MARIVIGRHKVHWTARIGDLRTQHDGSVRKLTATIGCGYDTVATWLWKGAAPLLSTAVLVSERSGYTLEHLVGPETLGAMDFDPRDRVYQHGSWPRGLRAILPLGSDNAIATWISDHTLMAERVPQSWFYQSKVPMLASAIETCRALGVDLDTVLRIGCESLALESAAE